MKAVFILAGIGGLCYVLFAVFIYLTQRSMLYFPTHGESSGRLSLWAVDGKILGYKREVRTPSAVWLMAHGNGGQASTRDYLLPCVDADAALYVVEYPGYGLRPGKPTAKSINQAVVEAYTRLVAQYPDMKIGVIGESLGGGPICELAKQPTPPRKIVLIVPFDTLVSVAAERMPFLPVSLLLRDRWNNLEALKGYAGPVEIYAASRDRTIPSEHARRLADAVGARFTMLEAGHNDWSPASIVIK